MKRLVPWRLSSFWWLALTVFLVAGCAGKELRPKDKGVESQTPRRPEPSIKLTRPQEEVFSDKKGDFRIVSTPAGYAKERVEKPEKDLKRPLSAEKPSAVPSQRKRPKKMPSESKVQPAQPAPRLHKEPTKKEVTEGSEQKIVLNFDNADLYEVINTIAELLGINYIVYPNVTGQVTIYTARGIPKKDLFTVFLQILDVNGLAAIKEGNLYKIVQAKDTPRRPIPIVDGKVVSPRDRMIIQIIPLKYISVQEMTNLLTPFVSANGTIVSDANSNTLLIVENGVNILKILRLIETFDVNIFEKLHYRFYPLKHLDAEEVVGFLSDFTSYYERFTNVFVKFIALTRMNTLLVISTTPFAFEKVEEILRRVDVPVEETKPRIYVYYVKNSEAKNLETLLKTVFGKGPDEKKAPAATTKKPGGAARLPKNPFAESRKKETQTKKTIISPTTQEQSKKPTQGKQREIAGAGALKAEVTITADVIRNALIIQAVPQDYQTILGVLRLIDVLPRQVLIEATIAEVTLDDTTELGMEWSYSSDSTKFHGTGLLEASVGADGLTWAIGLTKKWKNMLKALASQNRLNVLSSPHILASDNKEARIDVSREIPLASSEWTFTSGTEPVTQTNIQYRDAGVILSVTPHINERGLVTMDISQEVSELSQSVKVANVEYPSFFKRTVNTTLTVRHGQTLAIGGLIKDKEDESISGLPCLIHIPVFRYVFGKEKKAITKQELIVLITPRVIVNTEDVDAVTEEFKKKVRNVVRRFGY